MSVPETLSELLELFGRHLFESGQSIYLMRQLVTHVQRTFPDFRRNLGRVWQLVARWESLTPISHRTPLPLVIFQAMVALAISLGWMRWAGVAIIGFEGICRPGEPLQSVREDLLLPRDLVVENPAVVFLRIKKPKSRRRGLGLIQHAKISDLAVARFLDRVFGPLPRKEPLLLGSSSSFRRRWDHLLSLLDIPEKIGLTPASLRSGGAVRAYRADEELTKILWRMRIKDIETLQHYLQELGAISVFQELSRSSQQKISTARFIVQLTFGICLVFSFFCTAPFGHMVSCTALLRCRARHFRKGGFNVATESLWRLFSLSSPSFSAAFRTLDVQDLRYSCAKLVGKSEDLQQRAV